jgi:hypothetical protein
MLLFRWLEARNALVLVPTECADDPDVVVEAHLAVGDDVESGIFLVGDRKAIGIVERLAWSTDLNATRMSAPAAAT